MFDDDSEVSDVRATLHAMEAIAFGDEADARLNGLMAVLSLPLVREGAVAVQVEVVRGKWQQIDGVVIDHNGVTFSQGLNGRAQTWAFRHSEGIPPWRTVAVRR